MSYHESFKIVHELYKSMDFPQLSLEDSLLNWLGKSILLSMMNYYTGGSETQKMRLKGIPTPNYPSTVDKIFYPVEVD